MIAFIYQNTANLVFDCFGNSAMAGREDRQSACHRFQHGIGNAFLISITARFARVQKNLRRVKKLAQFFLRNEAREIDSAVDLKLASERLQFLKLRSIAGYGESRGWKLDRKSTRLNSSHSQISYAVFCLKKKKTTKYGRAPRAGCTT